MAGGGTKIDPVFAAAAAAALNATLATPSVSSSNPFSPNSSATVAAVAAAAMNAAALAAALGGGSSAATGIGSNFQLPGFPDQQQLSGARHRRSSPLDRRSGGSNSYRSQNRDVHAFRNDDGRRSSNSVHRCPEDDPTATRTIFVGNLPPDIRASELRQIFEAYGLLEDVDIKRPQSSDSEPAYAFLKYVNVSMAYRAKLGMTGKKIAGYTCKIGYGKVTPSRCLWVGGLGPWTTYPEFAALIERLGRPRKIIWPSGKSYANILFSSNDAAASVAASLRGRTIGAGGRHRLRVDFTDESHMLGTGTIDSLRRGGRSSRDGGGGRRQRHSSLSSQRRQRQRSHSSLKDRSGDSSGSRQRAASRSASSANLSSAAASPNAFVRSPSPGCLTNSRSPSPMHNEGDLTVETATNIDDLAACLPGPVWKAVFVLKKSNFSCRLFAVSGDTSLADAFIPRQRPPQTPPEDDEEEEDDAPVGDGLNEGGETKHSSPRHTDEPPLLRISQRMKMDPAKLDDVRLRMKSVGEAGYCVLLATEAGEANGDSQSRPLRDLINYLASKEAAGVVLMNPDQQQQGAAGDGNVAAAAASGEDSSGVLHVLPPSEFAVSLLVKGGATGLQTRSAVTGDKFLVILLIRSFD